MREHQIVITLKPEQFQRVQKLAREAGAKSMGMFVRQTLLAALGLEKAAAGNQEAALDLEPVIADLKRLHSELKDFVSESLSVYGTFDPDGQENPDALAGDDYQQEAENEFPGDEAELESPPAAEFDEMEEMASKAFAISPRLGVSWQETGTASLPEEKRLEQAFVERSEDKPRPILDSRRAFSQSGRDPLSELLEGEEMDIQEAATLAGQIDDDDTFDVPLSILTRRRELAAQIQAISDTEAGTEAAKSARADVRVPPAKPLKQDSDSKAVPEENFQDKEANLQSEQDISGSSSDKFPLGNPDDDTPFSGGPPPKKRQ